MIIREVSIGDVQSMLAFTQQLATDTRFMLLEPGEQPLSLKQQKVIIQNFVTHASGIMLVVFNEITEEIVGFCVGSTNAAKKKKHCIYCVMGLLKQYRGSGYGKRLLSSLEGWAKQNNYRRLELTVMETNYRAIKLYNSFGFTAEGIKRESIKEGNRYIDEISMSKLI